MEEEKPSSEDVVAPAANAEDPGTIPTVPVMGVTDDDPGPIGTTPLLRQLDVTDLPARFRAPDEGKTARGETSNGDD